MGGKDWEGGAAPSGTVKAPATGSPERKDQSSRQIGRASPLRSYNRSILPPEQQSRRRGGRGASTEQMAAPLRDTCAPQQGRNTAGDTGSSH